ncbi:uncharacterized protein TNCV_4752491 [Trichonephila clavipes]|nr:uncharacterized protein TNCV_4752491 [Trichonephila clavipes]
MDKTTLPAVMKMEDLINGECTIPERLDRFFKALIGGKDIRLRDEVNCHRLSNSLASDCVSNDTVKPSKHITLGMTVKSLKSSRKMINILNRHEHCCNYNTLEELETEATISSVNRSQICPLDIIQSPSLSTGVAFDNFDRYVDTLTGKDTLHDTVGFIYQNVSDDYDIELNSSSISENLTTQFKEALVRFFIEHWANDTMYPFIGNKTIYLSFDKCYSYHVLNNQVIRSIEESLSCEEHEEDDTRIIYHICQISVDAQVVVLCSDSDILIIPLGNLDHLNASLKLPMDPMGCRKP